MVVGRALLYTLQRVTTDHDAPDGRRTLDIGVYPPADREGLHIVSARHLPSRATVSRTSSDDPLSGRNDRSVTAKLGRTGRAWVLASVEASVMASTAVETTLVCGECRKGQ